MKNEGAYQWTDGTNITVKTNWQNREPNNLDGIEDCVEVRKDGKWNDQSCAKPNGFICERRLSNNKK